MLLAKIALSSMSSSQLLDNNSQQSTTMPAAFPPQGSSHIKVALLYQWLCDDTGEADKMTENRL
jgi:hypothetical protein